MPAREGTVDGDDAASLAPSETLSPGALGDDAPAVSEPAPSPAPSPTDRFRATVQRVIELNRIATYVDTRTDTPRAQLGREPGVDPRRRTAIMQYGHIREACRVSVVDYSALQLREQTMDNAEFVAWLKDEKAREREPWVKVRWINIEGISWDVVSALALEYELHPLAIEDVLHQPRSGLLSKADYYSKHLFLRVLCHTLSEEEDDAYSRDPLLYVNPSRNQSYGSGNANGGVTGLPKNASPEPMDSNGESDSDSDSGRTGYFDSPRQPERKVTFSGPFGDVEGLPSVQNQSSASVRGVRSSTLDTLARRRARRERLRHTQAIERLKAGDRVDVRVHPLCVFLLRSGTVITLTRSDPPEFAVPIVRRLQHRDTALRLSADPTLLVHALLDLVVDGAFPIVEAYQTTILALEHQILLRPRMATVRALHILQQDLAQHKRTLEPIKAVVYGLRRYDTDRAAALVSEEDKLKGVEARGFMSQKAKIYLADVVDHMDYVLTSMEMFSGTTDNLIDYTFNMISYSMNDTMKRLTLATIVFLPLTFLTGYFGMNFTAFYSINHFSDAFVWALGLPLVVAVTSIFMWGELVDMVRYIMKRLAGRHDGDIRRQRKARRKGSGSSRRSTR